MLNQSILFEHNPQLGLLNDIYQDTGNIFRDSMLSNYIQIAVAEVLRKAKDKSLFSLDIQSLLDTKELRSELDFSRYNYLQVINYEGINHALDLSQDFGGVAHFLADRVQSVDAVKIDSDRSRLSLLRCANKQNICHVSEDLDKLKLPVGHYDLIVIGEFEALQLAKPLQADYLAQLQAALSPQGVLLINAANRERVSRWLAPHSLSSDNTTPYRDLYNSPDELEVDHKELFDMLVAANYSAIDFHATFSQDKRCSNLFSEDYLTSNLNALNHCYRLGAIDNPEFNEYLFFRNQIHNTHRIFEMASRYVVIAGASSAHLHARYDNDFSYFAGTGRRAQWRTITERKRAAAQVSKTSIYPKLAGQQLTGQQLTGQPASDQSVQVQQNLAPQPFHNGRLLVDDWLQAVSKNDAKRLHSLVEEYANWLTQLDSQGNFAESAYDLLPFNIIVNQRGGSRSLLPIDVEWQINGAITPDFVLFRALFWFAFENKAVLRSFAEQHNTPSLALFVTHYHPNLYASDELFELVACEEQIQSQIDANFRSKSVAHALLQSFNGVASAIDTDPVTQVSWSDSAGVVDEANSIYQTWPTDSNVLLSFELPSSDAKKQVLRLDPIATRGLFSINSIQLFDQQQMIVFALASADEVQQFATTVNCQASTTADNKVCFTALNDDPHLLFDLSATSNLRQAKTLQVELTLMHDGHYDAALTALTSAVETQNVALLRQTNKLDQYRADLDYASIKIEDLRGHRADLYEFHNELRSQLQKEIGVRHRTVHEQNLTITNLTDQLVAQIGRNEALEKFLITRPSTRAKRVARRLLNRLLGRTAIEPAPQQDSQTEAQAENSEVQTSQVDSPEQGDQQNCAEQQESDPNAFPTSGELLGQNTENYPLWVEENTPTEADIKAAKAAIETFAHKPTFSILVPVYNVDAQYLIAMIRSVQAQIYPHWQLCLVDDASPKSYLQQILIHEAEQDERISIQLNQTNQGISLTSNDALAMATGDYISLLDHDDEISIDALYETAKAINQTPAAGLIYSDEDKMDMQGNRVEPYFKPDYSPDLLDTNNYVCHFTTIKKDIVDEISGFREGLDGSQDHDIILRAIMQCDEQVVHIPKILYHWRKIPGSTAVVYDSKSYAWEAGRKAVENTLQKRERGIHVELGSLKGTYRVFREIHGEPLVSIIIPFKDKPELLDSCLNSILSRSSYQNFEIIGVSNNSEEALTLQRMQEFTAADKRIRFVEKNIPFNFSAICNFGAQQAKGDYLLMLNNDIEIISPDWIERLLEHAQRPKVGAVGGKLLYPDGRIQHAGVVAGMVGAAGHPHKFFPDNHIGYHGRLHMVYNVSAVTGAMMMIQREKFQQAGGFDEENLAVAYNDIDLCLKLMDLGYLNVFTPHCKATHHESISRGYEDTPEKLARLKREQAHFLGKWSDFLESGDPFYNPNLSLKNERFSLNFRD